MYGETLNYIFETFIPLEPQAREEPQHYHKKKFGTETCKECGRFDTVPAVFTPKNTKLAQSRIKFHLSRFMLPTDKMTYGAVGVEVIFYRTPPKSKAAQTKYPDKRPDLDNFCKTLGDCLNDTILKDDGQIVDYVLKKRWAVDRVGIDVKIYRVE